MSVRIQALVCPACNKTVLVSADAVRRQKYCSRACARATYNREHFRGAKNPNWRGGKVLSYGPDWKRVKQLAPERDRVCQHCGKTPEENGRALDVHHIDPRRFSGSNSPDILIALCRSCHMRAEDHGRRGSAKFAGPIQLELRPPSQREFRRRRGEQLRAKRREIQIKARSMRRKGKSLRQIARSLGVSHQTIANWLRVSPEIHTGILERPKRPKKGVP